jgi:ABC-2 type transport system permease protein
MAGIFLREARYNFVALLRTRAYSFSVIGFPVMFYIFFGLMLNRGEHIGGVSIARYLLGGYSVFGAVGAALFGVGVALSGDLHAGWLELKRASPMPPLAYLMAKCVTAMGFGIIIVAILLTLGALFGDAVLRPLEVVKVFALTMVGTIPFACMGMLIALITPPNAAPGITNIIYLPMSYLGGLWLPIQAMPKVLQHVAGFLPTYHLGQLMLHAMGYETLGTMTGHWLYLAGFTLVLMGAAWIVFRRREMNA